MILDHPLISQRYFFPRPGSVRDPLWIDVGAARLACVWRAPHADAPALIHFHGNGEIVDDYLDDVVPEILQMGINVFLAEYRGYGRSTGTPALVGMLADVRAIVDALGLPARRLIAMGRSLGSIYAIELAARYPELGGLILESGIADPLERVLLRVTPQELGVSSDVLAQAARADLDHATKLGKYRGPLLIMHTENDGLVDRSHADRNFAWCASEQKELCIFRQGDHNSILFANRDAYMKRLRSFFAHFFS